MKKISVEEIKMDTARNTIINQHSKFGKTIGVNGCFGSSDLGQMTGFIAREIVKAIPNAFMRCPLALTPEIEGPSQVLFHDDFQVTIDGCQAQCLVKTLQKAAIKPDLSYSIDTDFKLEKRPGPDFDEAKMQEISAFIISDIKKKLV
jgi:uncharacterized metal-binding protein